MYIPYDHPLDPIVPPAIEIPEGHEIECPNQNDDGGWCRQPINRIVWTEPLDDCPLAEPCGHRINGERWALALDFRVRLVPADNWLFPFPWRELRDLARQCRVFYRSGNEGGGLLHVVLEDHNVDDHTLRDALKHAREPLRNRPQRDPAAAEIAEKLLNYPEQIREIFVHRFYDAYAEPFGKGWMNLQSEPKLPEEYRSDLGRLADNATDLLERLADRFPADQLRMCRSLATGGEWGELIDLISAVLVNRQVAVTPSERDALAELLYMYQVPKDEHDYITNWEQTLADLNIR